MKTATILALLTCGVFIAVLYETYTGDMMYSVGLGTVMGVVSVLFFAFSHGKMKKNALNKRGGKIYDELDL